MSSKYAAIKYLSTGPIDSELSYREETWAPPLEVRVQNIKNVENYRTRNTAVGVVGLQKPSRLHEVDRCCSETSSTLGL